MSSEDNSNSETLRSAFEMLSASIVALNKNIKMAINVRGPTLRNPGLLRFLGWQGPYLDFDQDPHGNPIADNTQLDIANNVYAQFGVTFVAQPGPQATAPLDVWVRSSPNATSPPNIISLQQGPALAGDNDAYGTIRVNFSAPVSFVGIDVRSSAPIEELGPIGGGPILTAYDEANSMVSQAFFPKIQYPGLGAVSASVQLVVTAPATIITYIVLSCPYIRAGNNQTAYWDDLFFN